MDANEYTTKRLQRGYDEGISINTLAQVYHVERNSVELVVEMPHKKSRASSSSPTSLTEKIKYCDAKYGKGKWHFLTGAKLFDLLLTQYMYNVGYSDEDESNTDDDFEDEYGENKKTSEDDLDDDY